MNISRRDLLRNALLASAATAAAAPLAKLGLLNEAPAHADTPAQQSAVLTLVHTNDPHGHIYLPEQGAGLIKLGSLIAGIRADMPNVLLMDAGDLIHGTPEEEKFEGKPIIDVMNVMKYDVATAGNHEFDFGQRITRQALAHANFPILSANVLDEKTGGPWDKLKPYIMREVASFRIAIFGLTTTDTVKIQFPKTLQGIRFAEPEPIARELVPRLRREEKADFIVFLSHLGYKADKELAAAVPDIDIIIGGHSHTRLEKQVWVNNTLIVQTGYYGRALGRTDVLLERTDAQGRARVQINGHEGQWWGQNGVAAPLGKAYPTGPLLDVDAKTAEDAQIKSTYAPYRRQMTEIRGEKLTTAQDAFPIADIKINETPLGDLLATAVRLKTKADIGLVPSSAIAKGLEAGAVTAGDAMDTIGGYTRQHLVTARVPGTLLRTYCKALYAPGQRSAQDSGLGESGEIWMAGGKPLEDGEFYTVAAAAYLVQDNFYGKDGVTILEDSPEAPTTREALIEFLRGHAPLTNRSETALAATH